MELSYWNAPKWRNGRRTRLKIWRQQWHEGSTPSFGTSSFFLPGFAAGILSFSFSGGLLLRFLMSAGGRRRGEVCFL